MDNVAISDLRRQPQFADAVADRVWRAWWQARGTPLSNIQNWVGELLAESRLPMALVAHRGGAFAGMATVIISDLADRPHYSPWVATLWVDPGFRNRRIGRALVARASAAAFALGFDPVYLCAQAALSPFYAGQGWTAIEHDVGERRLTVFSLAAAAAPGAGVPPT